MPMLNFALTSDVALLSALIFAAALLYASVGHAGASGYIAAMALFGMAPAVMKPTALVLNICVATLGTVRWYMAGLVNWRALAPLLIASIPLAFIGGALQLPAHWYRRIIGLTLILASAMLVFKPQQERQTAGSAQIPVPGGLLSGGAVGFLSGLTGTGGGIFLSPILLFLRWANPRQASGITVPFILLNSIAGLAGNLLMLRSLPSELPLYVVAALAGGLIGASIGISWASQGLLRRLLGLVLLIAGLKFMSA